MLQVTRVLKEVSINIKAQANKLKREEIRKVVPGSEKTKRIYTVKKRRAQITAGNLRWMREMKMIFSMPMTKI